MTQYRVLVGLSYPPDKRAEVGDVVDDLPAQSVKWLIADGLIEDASKPSKAKVETVAPIVEEPVAPVEAPKVEEPVEEVKIEEPVEAPKGFKPNAKDGDKDGFVQDGTPFERPVEEK